MMAIQSTPAPDALSGSPLLDQREGEDQHTRDREEQRRVGELATAHLDSDDPFWTISQMARSIIRVCPLIAR